MERQLEKLTQAVKNISGTLKATSNGLRQQFHFLPLDIKQALFLIFYYLGIIYNTEVKWQFFYGFNKH